MSIKFDEIKTELIEYLRDSLRLDVNEKSSGFNGRHLSFKLLLEGYVISEDTFELQMDDG